MISKVITGKSFYGCCRYVCQDQQRAVILESEGVREYSFLKMGHDFEINRQQSPGKHKAVFHGILSFHPDDKVTDEKMLQIAKEYLQNIGLTDTQYVIVKHNDTNHQHLHLIGNFVNNKGKVISDSWIGLRGKKAAQRLTQQHKLTPSEEKNIKQTNLEALSNEQVARYEIYQAVNDALPRCKTLSDLEKQLLKEGIDIQYKFKGDTQQVQGISFKKGSFAFKGSSIDRKMSIAGIEKTLQQQLQQEPKQANRQGLRR
ncbi:relaxase/mobilization nuclease-like protein [Chitinophaga dinghuensis]|uniref:Relaxase/mobilization nuclease-like protein n=1 Tax=Chitinophaga dinghuensis TaxID=1539050 RepID=A0A327VSD1_9BACT|nr:relaxase/mobilization nuclease domain-containing protein [Chitinophaga dinghuensis]RAJ78957.1 relaxase/mobilization nuclease-like protein [Chitinophaga dinghuensis]